MTTVGLCMIVKDEAQILERCLASVRSRIDHWLVIDTGSTDGTPDLVRSALADVPGRLYERPWVDFGYNRTEAVQAARVGADYTLLLDADEVLVAAPGFVWPELETDLVDLAHMTGNQTRRHTALLSNRRSWQFSGVLFERLQTTPDDSRSFLPDVVVREFKDGHRNTGGTPIERNTLDARVLEAALQSGEELSDEDDLYLRYRLAACYRDSNRVVKALEAYTERAELGGDRGEVADCLLQIAHLLQRSGADPDRVVAAYLHAWEAMPTRAEPLADLAGYAREQGRYPLARLMAQRALEIPAPIEAPYIDETVYRWRSQDEYAVASYWTGYVLESAVASRDLIVRGVLPDTELARVEQNLQFARARCEEAGLIVLPDAGSAATGSDEPMADGAASVGPLASVTAGRTAESDGQARIPLPTAARDDEARQSRGPVPAVEPESSAAPRS